MKPLFATLLLITMTYGQPEHPFLIVRAGDFATLRAKASTEPYAGLKESARTTSDSFDGVLSSTMSVKSLTRKYWRYLTASALMYILDDGNQQVYADRVRNGILHYLDTIAFDRSLGWSGVVPPCNAAFNSILALDIVYNHLDSADLAACENKIIGKIDLVKDETNWRAAPLGAKGTYDIYKGIRTTPDDEYYNHIMSELTPDGVFAQGTGYGIARYGNDDRLVKSMYMDVLELTGVDSRYYENPRLTAFHEFIYGLSRTPNGRPANFGDTNPWTNEGYQAEPGYRAINFSPEAAAYAWDFFDRTYVRGNILTYIVPSAPISSVTAVPRSRILADGGAYFREATTDERALYAALWNCTSSGAHSHKDVNAIHLSGYGESLLLNVGYAGWGNGDGGVSWNYVHDSELGNNVLRTNSHSSKAGGGILDGWTDSLFDFAVGDDGPALSDDTHLRSLLFVHPQDGHNGYFALVDEVDADAGENVKINLHPNTTRTTGIQTVADKFEYLAPVEGQILLNDSVKLSMVFPKTPAAVNQLDGTIVSWGNQTVLAQYLEVVYNLDSEGDGSFLTLFYPHDGTHAKPAMTPITQGGLSGVQMDLGGNVTDCFVGTSDTATHQIDDVRFSGTAALFRCDNGNVTFFFVRNASLFLKSDSSYGVCSDAPMTAYLRGTRGYISTPATTATFYAAGATGVATRGVPLPVVGSSPGSITVNLFSGTYPIELTSSGTPPDPLPEHPDTSAELAVASVTASSYQDPNVAVHVLDGDLGTRWSADGVGEWIRFDAGEQVWFDSASVAFYNGDTRSASFTIETADDSSGPWTRVYDGTSSGTTTGFETFALAPSVGRYLRITGLGNTRNTWNSYVEVKLYGAAADDITPARGHRYAEAASIRVSQRPLSRAVCIAFPSSWRSTDVSVSVHDAQGRQVCRQEWSAGSAPKRAVWDTSPVGSGLFIVRALGDGDALTRRVLVQKHR
ncbi:MAG: hypothetical protein GF331_03720 [Chitinivibrionales bacterium]|nr:hypothetical protein [Chitinivibrionales bacterium]